MIIHFIHLSVDTKTTCQVGELLIEVFEFGSCHLIVGDRDAIYQWHYAQQFIYISTQPVDVIVVYSLDNQKISAILQRKTKRGKKKVQLGNEVSSCVCQAYSCACDITHPEAYTHSDRITGGQIAVRLLINGEFSPSFYISLSVGKYLGR